MKKCLYCGASHNRRSAYCKDSHRTRYNERKRGEVNPVNKLFKSPLRPSVTPIPTKVKSRVDSIASEALEGFRQIPAEYETHRIGVQTTYNRLGVLSGLVGGVLAPKGKKLDTMVKWGTKGFLLGLLLDEITPDHKDIQVQVKPSRIEYLEPVIKGNKNTSSRNSALSFRQQKIDTIKFNREYRQLLGLPPKDFYMLVHGQSGHGKSYWTIKFAEYYQRNHGNVLFYAAEQRGNNLALQNIMNDIQATFDHEKEPRKLKVNDIIRDANKYDLLVFDSLTEMSLTPDEVKQIREKGNAAIVGVLQSTKDGNFKGGNTWLHDTDIMVQLTNRIANTEQKGRYQSNEPKTININAN